MAGRIEVWSAAQAAGYLAFVLGVTAFLQKKDQRLKFFNASQGVVYALHFLWLGNAAASSSALVSAARSFLALRFRSWVLAVAIVMVNVAAGMAVVKSPAGWLPVVASSAATIAIFTMAGIPLRCVLLGSTAMWLTNNILSRSIGGTMLEVVIAGTNVTTIIRMARRGKSDARPTTSRLGTS